MDNKVGILIYTNKNDNLLYEIDGELFSKKEHIPTYIKEKYVYDWSFHENKLKIFTHVH